MRQRKRGGICEKVTRKFMGKLMEDKGYFGRFVCMGSSRYQLPISSDKNVLFLIQGA